MCNLILQILQKWTNLYKGERTHKRMCEYAEAARTSGEPVILFYNIAVYFLFTLSPISQVFEVKGPSWLSTIPNFNFIKGCLMTICTVFFWVFFGSYIAFGSKYHSELWYFGTKVIDVDHRLCSIRPPDEIRRTPHSIDTTVKFWKG